MSGARVQVVEVDGGRLSTATWGQGPPEIIMLHDGLGSITQWRDVPANLAAASGRTVMAYDRAGHGGSLPLPQGWWPPDWLHQEAQVLDSLITATEATLPALVGHSDGGSIAAIHATEQTDHGPIVLLAAHSWLESAAVAEIISMRSRADEVVSRLGRFHSNPAAVFEAWSGVWTSKEFALWDIRPILHTVSCPTIVLQGTADEFATPSQATHTAAAIGDNAECRLLDGLRHLLHHDAPELVVKTIVDFLEASQWSPRRSSTTTTSPYGTET
ncbi:MAG: alpha/beta hydrolase [Acidimicrobiaceae bacterium]|jgi:pimeloyl-ACP methyl ester carboxylesterase|nr:alpha/beta hydrolase [Acidimicrobiaceae bacterium]MBT5580867.1 alpha/beta hydrolase [Acidimicrobiaceae bacterium]MBT5848849.1 alpha/beta hydrolase [Acidimicrobiaceae bacterium]